MGDGSGTEVSGADASGVCPFGFAAAGAGGAMADASGTEVSDADASGVCPFGFAAAGAGGAMADASGTEVSDAGASAWSARGVASSPPCCRYFNWSWSACLSRSLNVFSSAAKNCGSICTPAATPSGSSVRHELGLVRETVVDAVCGLMPALCAIDPSAGGAEVAAPTTTQAETRQPTPAAPNTGLQAM